MTTQELAYTEIERLVKSFKGMPASQRRGLNEMQTRLGYILPLFRALGWDTSNINEVSPEEKVSRGWVDFCAPRKKLIIELDGSQHLEQREYDEVRTKYFEAKGYPIMRFWNNDVMNNMEAVLKVIWSVLNEEERDEKTARGK